MIQNLGFVLEATLPGPSGSAPDFVRARSIKESRQPHPDGHHHHFIPSPAATPAITTLWRQTSALGSPVATKAENGGASAVGRGWLGRGQPRGLARRLTRLV